MAPLRILVTGAGGFVGKALTAHFQTAFPGAHLIGLLKDKPASSTIHSRQIEMHGLNLVSGDLSGLFAATKPDVVVHLAAISSVQQSLGAGGETFEENLQSGLRLIKAMANAAPDAALVFASSGEVYGRSFLTSPIATEQTAIAPNNPYARSKAALEFAIEDMFAPKGRAVALRLFNHFGPGQDDRFVIASFAAQLRAIAGGAKPTIRVGNLEAERDFLPIKDVLAAYVAAVNLAVAAKTGSFDVFNIASGEPRRIASALEDLIRLSGLNVAVEQDPSRMRPSEIKQAAGDATKFSIATDWRPQASWDDALAELTVATDNPAAA
jgi:GDP-4-dehydro-6-deoxy-D-mannose reductase